MFLIVVHHMTNSIWKDIQFIPFDDFVMDLTCATTDKQQLLMSALSYAGKLGDSIFFVCSAWFLLDKKGNNIKKCVYFFADIWVISLLMLVCVLLLRGGIDSLLLIESLFPNLFANNWYATCYLLLLLLYPILNFVIYGMERTKLLRTSLFLTAVYIFINFVHTSFFSSKIILWTAIYFLIAYVKLYMPAVYSSVRLNVALLAGGLTANIALIAATNFLGLRIGLLSDKLLYWNNDCSPLLILIAFAAFNLFKRLKFKPRAVGAVSKLTLLIYLFHENLLFRNYYRPYLWKFVHDTFGYRYVVLWLFGLSAFVYLVSIIVSFAYARTVGRITRSLCDKLYPTIRVAYLKIEKRCFGAQPPRSGGS